MAIETKGSNEELSLKRITVYWKDKEGKIKHAFIYKGNLEHFKQSLLKFNGGTFIKYE